MPDVERAGAIEDRFDSQAHGPQSQPEVVILLTPADEMFVEPIHRLEVGPPDAEVTRREPGLRRMPPRRVPPGLAVPAAQLPLFTLRR